MQELAHYWEKEFDWRKAEAQINSFSNYEMRVNGIEVRALHLNPTQQNSSRLRLCVCGM
jgi:hypothetical protein